MVKCKTIISTRLDFLENKINSFLEIKLLTADKIKKLEIKENKNFFYGIIIYEDSNDEEKEEYVEFQ